MKTDGKRFLARLASATIAVLFIVGAIAVIPAFMAGGAGDAVGILLTLGWGGAAASALLLIAVPLYILFVGSSFSPLSRGRLKGGDSRCGSCPSSGFSAGFSGRNFDRWLHASGHPRRRIGVVASRPPGKGLTAFDSIAVRKV
jgi:hypothetical protein